MNTTESETRRPGRPRSAQAHQAILGATLALLAEKGFEPMSIEEVAERAGVGKTTIYRRWPSKTELTIDAIRNLQAEYPIVDTGNLRTDLIALLNLSLQVSPTLIQDLFLRLVSELRAHPELFQVFYSRLLAPRMQLFEQMIERAKVRGEIRSDVDWLFVGEMLTGPLYIRKLIGDFIAPAPDDWSERVVDALLHGLAPR